MNVGSLFGALTGGNGPQVEIHLRHPEDVVALDHMPSWRLHKNPFWRVKHPASVAAKSLNPPPQQMQMNMSPQPQMGYPQQQQGMIMNQPNNTGMMMSPSHQPQQQFAASGMMPPHPQVQQYPPGPAPMSPEMISTVPMMLPRSDHHIYAYEAEQDIQGVVVLRLPPGKKAEHIGIKVQFVGRVDLSVGVHEGRPHHDFVSLTKELAPPGILYQPETVFPFSFNRMEKELESYRGRNVAVRYIVKVKLERKFLPPLKQEEDVWVQFRGREPASHEVIKMEVGIEDCLHIEFEYNRRHYHLTDTITGKIHFLLVQIKIKHMELAVIRRETSGEGVAIAAAAEAAGGASGAPNVDAAGSIFTETQTLVKYEIMDGAPVKGEVIPVKLSLEGIPADLTPTYVGLSRFSVRYFLNLVLVDEDDRRYFKQQEIILWRKDIG